MTRDPARLADGEGGNNIERPALYTRVQQAHADLPDAGGAAGSA